MNCGLAVGTEDQTAPACRCHHRHRDRRLRCTGRRIEKCCLVGEQVTHVVSREIRFEGQQSAMTGATRVPVAVGDIDDHLQERVVGEVAAEAGEVCDNVDLGRA